ncbi:MAG: chemotaxis protein CheW [Desulfobacteraceae bacterium]|nr:chemotaxis protein CheW [Desulfobacteraceae bacterium]
MTYKIVQELVEKLSLEFVLIDSSEPETLSELLPVLKGIRENSIKLPLETLPEQVLKIEKIVEDISNGELLNIEESFNSINNIISEIETFMHTLKNKAVETSIDTSVINNDAEPEAEELINIEFNDENINETQIRKVEESLEKFSKLIAGFCPGEIPDLGAMLNICDEVVVDAKSFYPDTFEKIILSCKDYVSSMTLEDIENTQPIEEGVTLLKALLQHIKTGKDFAFDISDVVELLTATFSSNESDKTKNQTKEIEISKEKQGPKQDLEEQGEPEKVSDEDLEILVDFISEASENLDSIEISLIELEHDPADNEIINNIFRPFHTIKGVSGFLGLTKINTLAHTTENLLDSARSGDFLINEVATDAILESVDTLKKLLERVEQGIEKGLKQQDNDIDVNNLRDKLKKLQISLTQGDKQPLGEILVEKGVVDDETLADALISQTDNPEKKIGEILVEENKVAPKDIASALMAQSPKKRPIATQVKVNTEKLDNLVDYAGELVIAQSMLRQQASNDPILQQSVSQLGQIVTSMQNIAMSMRMIPIKATFMKMIRLVRDLSQKSGKKVDLNMAGEETEIDRNVVDALYEPMVHMIRNSVDHGIESKQDRQKSNKPAIGNIALRAYHKGGNIIIEIEDDGKGLDKFGILEKAIDTNLVSSDADLTDEEIYNLILKPGFSTAKEVTDISGRGVGMDVVKGGIEKFRGQLNINSTPGQGTKFTISLPLTLAIIDGMLVRVGKEKFIIPTIAIKRSFRPEKENCSTIKGEGEIVKERGTLIPLVRLKSLYGFEDDSKPPWESLIVVVESKNEQRGLLIDELLGKDEYVIKSLGTNLENIDGFAGGAILADGRVGLILDIHGLFKIVSK